MLSTKSLTKYVYKKDLLINYSHQQIYLYFSLPDHRFASVTIKSKDFSQKTKNYYYMHLHTCLIENNMKIEKNA